jgi:hypothetical protein
MEGGYTSENGKIVPFYQFRHLTFQEYLAAVAAVEGHTLSGTRPGAPAEAIGDLLLTDEWKEVVPMAAVLARRQATELIEVLINAAETELAKEINGTERSLSPSLRQIPPAANLIAQSMAEEADFSADLAKRAADIVFLFLNSSRQSEMLTVLASGPYAPDIWDSALNHVVNGSFRSLSLAYNFMSNLEAVSISEEFWSDDASEKLLLDGLHQEDIRQLIRGIFRVSAAYSYYPKKSTIADKLSVYEALETLIFDERVPVYQSAIWTWGYRRNNHLGSRQGTKLPKPNFRVLNRLVSLFIKHHSDPKYNISYIYQVVDLTPMEDSQITLSENECTAFRAIYDETANAKQVKGLSDARYDKLAVIRIAYMLPCIVPRLELIEYVRSAKLGSMEIEFLSDVLDDLGIKFSKKK